ncbi:MAG: GlsB/YeaQ/YmgE family stress response membrane protein [Planctomycetaceae bacterium]
MADGEWIQIIEQSLHEMLVWVGFGTIVGLCAKAVMPGKDPGGAVATMLMGIAGTVIGCGTLFFFWDGHRVSPISPVGFGCATGGAFVLLVFYRMLSGSFFYEGEDGETWLHRRFRRRRREAR